MERHPLLDAQPSPRKGPARVSRELSIDDRQQWEWDSPDATDDAETDNQPPYEASVLDRIVLVPAHLWRWAAVSVALVSAFLLRFPGLDRWPLDVTGANVAQTAHQLVLGERGSSDLVGMPFSVEWTALFLFIGGSADSVARVAFAVAGLATVALFLALSEWIGVRTAAAASVLAALSPTLIANSRQLSGGALMTALTLIVIVAAARVSEGRHIGWAAVSAAAAALVVLSHPLGLPALLLGVLAVLLVQRDSRSWTRDASLIGVIAFVAAYVLSSTALLTRPGSLSASTAELFERLSDDYLSEIGTRFYMPAFNLILNEPLLLVFAIVALVTGTRRDLVRGVGIWFVGSLLFASLFAADSAVAYAVAVLPLVALAAIGAVYVVERLPWDRLRQGPALLYTLAVLLMATAVVSLIGLVTGGTGDDTVEWLLRFALIVLVAILPLSFAITSIGQRIAGDRLILILAGGILLVGALTLRSSVMTASEWPDEPGNPLSTSVTGADIPLVVGRLERLSRDLTMGVRDSRDPTGGHGLSIAIDEEIEQPFRWYFRDYPNLTVFDPDTSAPPLDTQVVLLDGDREIDTVVPSYSGQTYLYSRGDPQVYSSPDWSNLLVGLIDPDGWRRFADFLINREPSGVTDDRQLQLAVAPDIAQRLFPAQGPFGLLDRQGAGRAEGQLNGPRGVAVGADGSTYVVDSRNARVQKYAPTGEFLLAFGSEGAGPGQLGRIDASGGGGPSGITFGSDGNVYVADTWNHRIQVFTPDGEFVREWGQFFDALDSADASASPGMFYGPRGISAYNGLIFVTDTGNERVQVFEEDGTFVRAFGGTGTGESQLLEPVGVAVGSDGTVLVADSHNARIARFTTEGEWLEPWPIEDWAELRFFEPYLAVTPDGTLYASTSTEATVLVVDQSGSIIDEVGEDELRQPFGITVESGAGALLVTDGVLHGIVRVPLEP